MELGDQVEVPDRDGKIRQSDERREAFEVSHVVSAGHRPGANQPVSEVSAHEIKPCRYTAVKLRAENHFDD